MRIDPELVLPDVRAKIENDCSRVAKGEATKEEVLGDCLAEFHAKFLHFEASIEMMDSLFEATFSPLAETGKYLSKCGKCRRFMRFLHLRPQRLHCATCNETYSLPQNGTIKLYKELTCPLDSFQLVLFSLGNSANHGGKSYPVCPYCFNHPPFPEIESLPAGGMGCNLCLSEACPLSAKALGVCPCLSSYEDGAVGGGCRGNLILDINSKPNWKLSCNRCDFILQFSKVTPIHNISIADGRQCADCADSNLLKIEFHKDKSPLGDGTEYQGCIMCDALLNSLIEFRTGRKRHISLSRRGGRGGRGRRGRGRGRGGFRKGEDPKMSFRGF
jgi:DNA topoisomerase-3